MNCTNIILAWQWDTNYVIYFIQTMQNYSKFDKILLKYIHNFISIGEGEERERERGEERVKIEALVNENHIYLFSAYNLRAPPPSPFSLNFFFQCCILIFIFWIEKFRIINSGVYLKLYRCAFRYILDLIPNIIKMQVIFSLWNHV